MEKTVVTVVGKDAPGIIAKTSAYLFDRNINILDISQTIVGGIFNMMMIVDTAEMDATYVDFVAGMEALGKEIGVIIRCQKEEIFDMMHRI